MCSEGGLSERTALAEVQARGRDRDGAAPTARPHASEGSDLAVLLQGTGGREHLYSAEELDEMGFEIVEEPDNRPVLQIEIGFRTD